MSENRIIFHIDVNSAYLSWTAVKRLQDGEAVDIRTIPAAVGGDENSRHGVVLAKSIPAQKFGVKTGESLFEARQKCPNLKVVPAEHEYYSMMSKKLFDLLNDYSPLVEKFSIDEGFLDYTGLEGLYGEPMKAAFELKERIKREFGFTVNIGVAPNKILAKMAGELKKPDLVHSLFHHELESKLWPLPIRELFMVGKSSERVLVNHGIDTIGKLAGCDQETVIKLLKSHGHTLWKYANGIDNSPVVPSGTTAAKSFSHSTTLSRDAESLDDANPVIHRLVQSACMRMRSENYQCSTVSVTIKYADFTLFSRQTKVKTPTDDTDYIYKLLKDLYAALWNGRPVRLIGVSLNDLSEKDDSQMTIFDAINQQKHKKLDAVCDKIRMQFGKGAIGFGDELKKK